MIIYFSATGTNKYVAAAIDYDNNLRNGQYVFSGISLDN